MRALSLFSGIGGMDLAAEWAGFETVAFCEYVDFPRKVLQKHWPDVPIYKDIRELNKELLMKEGVIDRDRTIKLVHGGFPCQPYSVAGKRLGKADDRDLWPEMFRVIEELQPSWVVGENVANFVNMELERTLIDLESEGYETQSFIIPAAAVDAKHQRNRTFIVAHANSLWESQSQGRIEDIWGRIGNSSEIMADTESLRSRRLSIGKTEEESRLERNGKNVAHAYSQGLERSNRSELESPNTSRYSFEKSEWPVEPRVGRVADGVPNRVDRIRTLGNAVVPQQIYPIFAAIAEIERQLQLVH
ncbi:DNA cytosine methyltransferase [Enterococcus sp. AZ163]|uniref:DNA cytosine methyltransferase n=1 Tax=Enterococcus sp. AZ163 TaxID=2774638 RepID=UPI003D2A2B4B